jgi:hypothetical protein
MRVLRAKTTTRRCMTRAKPPQGVLAEHAPGTSPRREPQGMMEVTLSGAGSAITRLKARDSLQARRVPPVGARSRS